MKYSLANISFILWRVKISQISQNSLTDSDSQKNWWKPSFVYIMTFWFLQKFNIFYLLTRIFKKKNFTIFWFCQTSKANISAAFDPMLNFKTILVIPSDTPIFVFSQLFGQTRGKCRSKITQPLTFFKIPKKVSSKSKKI